MKAFNDDLIRRNDLPMDAFSLIHDLCYHVESRDISEYVKRAQDILKKPTPIVSFLSGREYGKRRGM